MAWRLARSLVTLRDQINALSPNRSRESDGTIGDTSHAARKSDHNPDAAGIVRAWDVTNDPAHGIDSRKVVEAVAASRDSRIGYIISNGQILSGAAGVKPWQWRPYKGANKHNHHAHISVVAGKAADDPGAWTLNLTVKPTAVAKSVSRPKNPLMVEGNKGPDVERLQRLLNAAGAKLTIDADFGARTRAAVIAFQRKRKLVVDGKAGPQTWTALGA